MHMYMIHCHFLRNYTSFRRLSILDAHYLLPGDDYDDVTGFHQACRLELLKWRLESEE